MLWRFPRVFGSRLPPLLLAPLLLLLLVSTARGELWSAFDDFLWSASIVRTCLSLGGG